MAIKTRSKLGSKRQLNDGQWLVRVRKGYRADGKPRELSKVCPTERDADMTIAQFALEMGRNEAIGSKVTLSWYFYEVFIPYRMAYLTKATIIRYKSCFKKDIEPRFGDYELGDIPHAQIQAWINHMTYAKAKRCITTLRATLRAAWDDGYIPDEPMRHRLRYPRNTNDSRVVWSAQQVSQAIKALENSPLEALALCMVGGGLRREEAYALFWDDIEFVQVQINKQETIICRVTVDDAVTPEDGRKETKTRFSDRVITIAEPFSSQLKAIQGKPKDPICDITLTHVGRVWKNHWTPLKRDCPNNKPVYRGKMLEANVPYIPMSRLRATHETLLQRAGVADTVNAAIHGRSELSSVGYKHYLVPGEDTITPAAQAMGALIYKELA
ncbi:MAG: tyrosine-type recombinase/integrase family protein [Atopobium minutum]|uniref:site-specific integrase n=1 Tax=Atopobium minutum TaxID=1381 RepID=UPI001DA227A8|nr:site-specific integrase [Atopobium minutum]MBS4874123.1 tyrosine-type recombinase/integrase family protein [Atopobium minutum]